MSTSSSISTSTVNGVTRLTGLSSGLDVDTIVSEMVTAEKAKKLNKLEQKEQLAEWKQTAYQSSISAVQTFASTYFDTTSSTSLLSSANFKKYTVTSSSTAVTASYTSAASAGTHSVTVSKLATQATLASSASLSKDVQGSSVPTLTSSALSGESIDITVDGTDHTVSLTGVTSLATLQTAIDTAVGSGMLTVTQASSTDPLTITAASSGVGSITLSDPSSGTSGLDNLGFSSTDGAILSNRLSTSDTLAEVASQLTTGTLTYDSSSDVSFTINGTTITAASTVKLSALISQVNASGCGATMKYDSNTGKLVLIADDTGSGNTLTVAQTSGNFVSLCLSSATDGNNAEFTVDGEAYTRASNTNTIDGVTYTLNDTTTDATATADQTATVGLTLNTDGVYDLIKSFVTDYNALIASTNSTLDESASSDYQPLTDDQKSSMTDSEITKWEAKAKTGILEHDSLLTSMLSELRSSMVNSISGLSTSIFDIGIDTGTYDEKGKLYITEDTLKAAIQSNPDAVMNLFTQASSSYSGTTTDRSLTSSELSTRYNEEGIAYRFYDVIAKYTSTLRDNDGNKGLLLQKAGITGDSSSTTNTLSKQISAYATAISEEEDRLSTYSDKMYKKYSTLETYINKMNTQLSSLTSMTSSSSSSG